MKTIVASVLIGCMLTSCSKNDEEFNKAAIEQTTAGLARDRHFQYPTLQSKVSQEAVAELNATGDQTKLSTLNDLANPSLVDSIYQTYFAEINPDHENSRKKLIDLYRSVVAHHAKNDYQKAFLRSNLSRSLLTRHDLVSHEDAESIAFFTEELIGSKMGEYPLIIECLEKISGKIPAGQFRQMTAQLRPQIKESELNETRLAAAMKELIATQESTPGTKSNTSKGRALLRLMKERNLDERRAVLLDCSDRLSKL